MSFNKNKSTMSEILQHIRDVIISEKDFEVLELKNPLEDKTTKENYSSKVTQESNLENLDVANYSNVVTPKQEENLISENNTEITNNAIKDLLKNIDIKKQKNQLSSSMTVEQLVAQSVSPLLSKWLNDHLASIVKKIVEKEIQKITINNS